MKELETAVTQKGQVTIPREVRQALGIKPRDKVRFELDGDSVTLRRAASQILAGYGSVTPRHQPEDWQKVREDVEAAVVREVRGETASES